jgi:hypothetical protein
MKALKKSAMAAALATGVMFGGTAQSYIIGPPGEALLYPFVYYDDAGINTYLALHTTSFYGQDTVPNAFTAPHVWNNGNPVQPLNPTIHLHWFDYKSVEVYDARIPVTLNDKELIDLSVLGTSIGNTMAGVPGYIVLIDEQTRAVPSPAASFIMMGDAALVDANGNVTELPVLPMPDGADVAGDVPTNSNNCVYDPIDRIPVCTPITPGTRRDNDDAVADTVVVDIELAALANQLQTLIIWQDRNYGANFTVSADRFDDEEVFCSTRIPAPWEVSVVVLQDPIYPIGGVGWWGQAPKDAKIATLCESLNVPVGSTGQVPGILRLILPEGDTTPVGDGPNTALVAFTITATDQTAAPTGLVTHLGHDLGKGAIGPYPEP